MCSELPKEFQKTTEVLPFTKYGISTAEEFRKVESDIQHLEWLKNIGLTSDEIILYQENEAGLLDQQKRIESNVLKSKLEVLYNKINEFQNASKSHQESMDAASTADASSDNILARMSKQTITFYPEGHPMNKLKNIESELFSHLKNDIIPITKRRKILRRLERKKDRILSKCKDPGINLVHPIPGSSQSKHRSLWDVKEKPGSRNQTESNKTIGPKKQTMYTIKENKIFRLELVQPEHKPLPEYRAVDIVIPINVAEEQLLEGTKMCLDDIKKIERFKDYEPGTPSKVLFLKNIAPSISREQLMLLFNQFHLENGGPVSLRLMNGRMHGQAFVTFQREELAIQALEEVNGTILGGRPVVALFGRNSNRIQAEENR